jgi:hypothetical protein
VRVGVWGMGYGARQSVSQSRSIPTVKSMYWTLLLYQSYVATQANATMEVMSCVCEG